MRVTVFDGYVDEPSRLGVPPFISPYPRYAAGAVLAAGHEPELITVDHWRAGRRPSGDLLFIISGALVPGKYLRSMPMSGRELASILESSETETLVWHPAEPQTLPRGVHRWGCDPDALLYDALHSGNAKARRRTQGEWAEWPVLGAPAIMQHQDFPQPLICEIDMSYGCPHFVNGGCSFCTEPLFGMPVYREPPAVVAEIKALLKAGCTNFRLGGQSCIFSYMAKGVGDTPVPRPNPDALSEVFKPVSKLQGIRVLHTDNADPSLISGYPEESERILEMIVGTCTSGNILSLGLESADQSVAERNNLNSTAKDAEAAVRAINAAGREVGENGMPRLLPGLNFLTGLEGETEETFALNAKFLDSLVKSDMAVRRINVRQVAPTRRNFPRPGNKKSFLKFKDHVREKVDPVMLERVAPTGTVLRDVYTEVRIGKLMFSRQVGTYPVLVAIPQKIEPGRFLDVMVTALGSRSLTAVEYPLDVNNCDLSALEALPGIGRKRAIRLFRARPVATRGDIEEALEDAEVSSVIVSYFGDKLG